jgi:hypothetical protein
LGENGRGEKMMRRYFIGALVGFLIASAFPAYGAVSSVIGKKITSEYRVVVDGKILPKKSIFVDGTNYIPARAFAETFGYDIDFKENTVLFTAQSVEVSETTGGEVVPETRTVEEIDYQINSLKSTIKSLEWMLEITDRPEDEKSKLRQQISDMKSQITELENEKAALQTP